MVRRKVIFGMGAGVASLAVDGLTNILILRLLIQYLPAEAAGYWVIVTSAGSLLLMLQFGMGPTIARVVAGALGAREESQLQSLLGAIRAAFRIIALLVAAGAILIFVSYLRPTGLRAELGAWSVFAWFPYALGLAANLQGQSSLFVLNGYGQVGWDKVLRALFTATGFVAVWLALVFGAGLMELGLVYLTQHLLFWLTANQKMKSVLGKQGFASAPMPGQLRKLFRDGLILLLMGIVTFTITQFTIFVVEWKFGIDEVVGYAALLRVGVFVGAIGLLLPQMLYPFVAKYWSARDYDKCRRYYFAGVVGSLGISLAICIPLLLFGKELFHLWMGQEVEYDGPVFLAIIGFYLVYVHHCGHAIPALAVIGRAFVIPSLIIAGTVGALLLVLPDHFGLVGVPLAMILGTLPASAYVVCKSWRIVTQRE